jgi:hypothetical protein
MQSLLRRLADIILVRSLLVAGCGGGTTSPSGTSSNTAFNGSPSPAISPALEVNNQQVVVQLNPMNNSGEASTTTLRTEASGTRVNITNLSGYPGTASPTASSTTTTSPLVGVQQSAASYKGTCAQLSPTPAYPLALITYQGGSTPGSRSTVSADVATLTHQNFAIAIHKSTTDATPYRVARFERVESQSRQERVHLG